MNLSGLLESSIFFNSFLPTPGAPKGDYKTNQVKELTLFMKSFFADKYINIRIIRRSFPSFSLAKSPPCELQITTHK